MQAITDGGGVKKKKEAQTSYEAMVEAEQALKKWQREQQKKAQNAGVSITLPKWTTLKQAREQKNVTYEQLNNAKKLSDIRQTEWKKLSSIYERNKTTLEGYEKKLNGFKYLANDYQQKVNRLNDMEQAYKLNPSELSRQSYEMALQSVLRWENDHKRDIDTYGRLVEEYNSARSEYNRAAESLNHYSSAYQRAQDTYSSQFSKFDWSDTSGLSENVLSDYKKVLTAQNDANSQAYVDLKNQLQDQKKELEEKLKQLSESTKSAIDSGMGNAQVQLDSMKSLNSQIDEIDKNLSVIENYAKAKRTENIAKQDPKFEEYVAEGKKKLEQYFRMSYGTGMPEWYKQYQNMDEEQQAVYAYLTGKDSASSDATEYLQSISAEVNQKIASDLQKSQQEYAQEHPVKAGITSVLAQPYAAITTLGEALGGIGGEKTVDPNTAGARLQQGIQTYRSAGLDQIENPVLNTLAQAGYSIADMLPAVGLTALAGPAAGGAYMGVLQGTGSYNEAVQRGLTRNQALAYGTTSAVVSSALESIGLDEIGKAFAGGKNGATQLLRGIVGSFVSEGSEEAAENVAQLIYDDIIAGEKSNVNAAKKQYMAQGMSEKEAEIQAWKDVGLDTLNSFIVGGLAGGTLAAVGGGANAVANYEGRPNISYNALTELGLSEDAAKALVDAQLPEVVNALRQSAKQFNVSEEVSSRIETLSNDTNTKVVFDGSLKEGESGFYNPSTQEIHLNPNINNTTIIFSHELTHSLENTSAYNKLSELVLSQIQDIDKVRQDKISLYKEHGIELDDAGVDAEVVAEYVSNKLFSDQEAIQRVANYDLSLAGRIKNWISRMAAKVTGKKDKEFLLKAESLYAKAIQEAKTITDMRTANSLARSFKVDGNLEENMQNALNQVNYKPSQATSYSINNRPENRQIPGQTELIGYESNNNQSVNENQEIPKTQTENEKYNQQVQEYGEIPQGEQPRGRDISVPQSTNGNDKVSRFTRTEMEAKATPDSMIKNFETHVSEGDFSYTPKKQKDILRNQVKYIQEEGYQEALKQWKGAVKRGTVDDGTMILGQVLYSEAAKAGDTKLAMDLAAELAAEGTALGQAVSSMRMLKRLTPEGKLYYAQKSVDKIISDLKKQLGDKAPDIKINKELAQKMMDAKTQQELEEASIALYTDIANQMPNTWWDKWDAWRYLAMLFNPSTHVRNIAGNVAFGNKYISMRSIKNRVGAGIEAGVNRLAKLTGTTPIERTKSFYTRKADRVFAKSDFENMKSVIRGDGKYNSVTGLKALKTNPFSGGIIGKTKLDKPLNALSTLNSKALDAEDFVFMKGAYVDSMAQYMKSNKLKPEDMTGSTLEKARTYAVKEAQKSTFRDANALAAKLNSLSNTNIKPLKIAMKGLLPFTKTPANIVKRGIEYSPIGLLNGIKQAAYDVRKGNKTAAEAIDTISSGLTGSGVMALGIYLASQGLLIGGDDDSSKKQIFDEMTGNQSYAFDLSPLGIPYTYTIDWAAPTALPLFVGVELWNAIQASEEGGSFTFADAAEAITDISEPIFNLTMLDGINSAIQQAGYDQAGAITSFATSAFTDYFTQGVPTILGKINRSFVDNTRRTSYVENNSPIPDFISRAFQSAQMKIPGLSTMMNPYQDAFGREESNGSWWENFFSPGYLEKKSETFAETEIERLYDETGESSILPSKPEKSITVNGNKVYLTAKEYKQYVEEKGKVSLDALNSLVQSKEYKNLDSNGKVKAITDVYKYADALAKAKLSDYKPDTWITEMKTVVDQGTSLSVAMAFRAANGKNTKEKSDILLNMNISDEDKIRLFKTYASDSRTEDVEALLNEGISIDNILMAQSKYSELYGLDEKNSVKASEFSKWLDSTNMDKEEKNQLRDTFVFYNMSPVESTNYDKFTEAGINEETAMDLANLFYDLQPEEGEKSVSNSQKYQAIASSDLSDKEKLKAFSSIMEESTYNKFKIAIDAGASMEAYANIMHDISRLTPENGKDEVTSYQKYQAAANSSYNDTEKIAVLSTLMSESQFDSLQKAYSAGSSIETFTDLLNRASLLDPEEGKTSVSNNQKYLMIAESEYSADEKLATLYGLMTTKEYDNLETALDSGIDMSVYTKYKLDLNKISADKDENGNNVTKGMGTQKSKRMAYINSLPISNDQKDTLYLESWKESTIDEAPWHGGELYQGDLFGAGEEGKQTYEIVSGQDGRITQGYSSEHTGVDIGWPSEIGPNAPLYAPKSGVVTWTQTGRGNDVYSQGNETYGNLVEIQMEDGSRLLLAHMSNVMVEEGDSIIAGQQLGNMGDSGNAEGVHVHVELRDANGNEIDPTSFITGDVAASFGGTYGSGSSGSSSSSSSSSGSSKTSSKKSSKLSPITLSTTKTSVSTSRTVPTAQRLSVGGAIKLSLPTVQKVTKSAVTGSSSGVKTSSLGITSRNSRSSSAKGFIKI